jgi:hypothetical protein
MFTSITRFAIAVACTTALVLACGSSGDEGTTNTGAFACDTTTCGNRKCDIALGCVSCLADTDCQPGAPRCVRGGCQACATNADCGVAAPSCWPSDNDCHTACTNDQSCPGTSAPGGRNLRFCDTSTGACLECKQNSDCPTNAPLCEIATGRCLECTQNSECPAARPRCIAGRGRCAECTSNADCGAAEPRCDLGDFECRSVACTTDAQCSGATPKCNVGSGNCVQCLVNTECPATAPICEEQRVCVQCLRDQDCAATPATPRCRGRRCRN